MTPWLDKLVSIGSDPLCGSIVPADQSSLASHGALGGELLELLRAKNGFFAFESALQVFPLGGTGDDLEISAWNRPSTWRWTYSGLIPDFAVFFSQDVFGNQFALLDGVIARFVAEGGELQKVASSLEAWAQVILTDWRQYLGYDLAHVWQTLHRPLREGERLVPKIPFVLGGEYDVSNLYAGNIVETMRFRGELSRQIAGHADGTRVNLVPKNVPPRHDRAAQ